MKSLFVYGLLKDKKVQQELLGKSLDSSKAKLKDFALYQAEDGYFFIKGTNGENVEGYLLEDLTQKDFEILDAFEVCPTMYQRKTAIAVCDGRETECYVYIRVDDVGKYKRIDDYSIMSGLNEDEMMAVVQKFKTRNLE